MRMTKKRQRGRPIGTTAERTRDVPVQFKVFPEEKAAYEQAAQREGLTMSGWIRQQINRAAKEGE